MENNELINNKKSTVDFLGNKLTYECMGCAIANYDIITPGGLIYEDSSFTIQQDPLIPIKGFIIINAKKHINSITMLNDNERLRFMELINMVISYLKDLKVTEEVTMVQEERSRHLHIWIFPYHSWMDKNFGKGVSYLRGICEFAKENAIDDDKREVLDVVTQLRNKFKGNNL